MMPIRVQRRRTAGWRMPPDTVYVGRGSKWGNPYRVGAVPFDGDRGQTLEECLWAYRHLFLLDTDTNSLKGKNLACWCPLDQPCHADILLELANK